MKQGFVEKDEKEYPILSIGDVVQISKGGWGLCESNEGLYCIIEEYSPEDYYGGTGYLVSKYNTDLVNHDWDDWVGVETFGTNPLVLFNIHEEHVADEEHTVIADGSKDEVERVLENTSLGIDRNFDSSLDKRKNGKNKMELVETGFPNAFLALGEVMTWAADYKGYEPNDWKDIPNPSMSLLGAASRHRNKRLKGEEFDDESGLPHLTHEAFNVLAQLELMMIGKLK